MNQPKFNPQDNVWDYIAFKSFLENFKVFTRDVTSKVDILRWLKMSVLGAANDLIKGLATEIEANYDIAI